MHDMMNASCYTVTLCYIAETAVTKRQLKQYCHPQIDATSI